MTRPRNGAIVGFGNVAANGHLPIWRDRRDFRIVAVADAAADRRALAERLLPGVRTYPHHDDLLRHEQLDFVDIATPPAWHAPAIVAAARAGVDVLCEKPLTPSLKDYRAVRGAVGHAGVVLHTVHNWKYSEAFRTVRQLLAEGSLGRLTTVAFDTARNGCAGSTGDNWRVQAGVAGGGILVDHGWHLFYLLLSLAEEQPSRVRATLARHRYVDAEVEDTAVCQIEFPSLAAEIHLTWAATERRTRWRFVGEDGELLIDEDRVLLQRKAARHTRYLTTALSAGSYHPEWFDGVIDSFRAELDDPHLRGTNQAEAEWCLLMLNLAYASDARASLPMEVPHLSDWFDGSAPT